MGGRRVNRYERRKMAALEEAAEERDDARAAAIVFASWVPSEVLALIRATAPGRRYAGEIERAADAAAFLDLMEGLVPPGRKSPG
jgi:hypothetical protein